MISPASEMSCPQYVWMEVTSGNRAGCLIWSSSASNDSCDPEAYLRPGPSQSLSCSAPFSTSQTDCTPHPVGHASARRYRDVPPADDFLRPGLAGRSALQTPAPVQGSATVTGCAEAPAGGCPTWHKSSSNAQRGGSRPWRRQQQQQQGQEGRHRAIGNARGRRRARAAARAPPRCAGAHAEFYLKFVPALDLLCTQPPKRLQYHTLRNTVDSRGPPRGRCMSPKITTEITVVLTSVFCDNNPNNLI